MPCGGGCGEVDNWFVRQTGTTRRPVTLQADLLGAVGSRRGAEAADRLCDAVVVAFGVDAAAISLTVVNAMIPVRALGASGDLARRYEELHFTCGEGPCWECAARGVTVGCGDLADRSNVSRWPGYGPALLAHRIRAVYAVPVTVAGQCVGVLSLFDHDPNSMSAGQLVVARDAAAVAVLPVLDVRDIDLHAAVEDPDSAAWAALDLLCRAEINQAVGMLTVQLKVGPVDALIRLRAHAYLSGHTATEVACDILAYRLRLTTE